jgi:hypothetical protein
MRAVREGELWWEVLNHTYGTVCIFPHLAPSGAPYDTNSPTSIERYMRRIEVGIRPFVLLGVSGHVSRWRSTQGICRILLIKALGPVRNAGGSLWFIPFNSGSVGGLVVGMSSQA